MNYFLILLAFGILYIIGYLTEKLTHRLGESPMIVLMLSDEVGK